MKVAHPFPATVIPLLLLFVISCGRDPRATGEAKPKDVVSITKVTKFALEPDGTTPMHSLVGAVRMSHLVHEQNGIGCETCHHKKGNDDRIKTCAAKGCHTGIKGYNTMHGLCEDCHNKRLPGREKCMKCH